jgi:hypothetical protein
MEPDGAAPVQATVTELERLRSLFRESIESYVERVDSEINEVIAAVSAEAGKNKISAGKMRDLRDMLTLLRHTQIKPDKGRRKDIKKLDGLVGDLKMLVENW